ncbi:claudin-14-like isoform X2 [Genypterus blacodes]|uniref:claudin-14-like isoform X2 n=1 Tax=Genypterus blacodes TaxID=154954 RepID=UPI003F76868E
MSNVAVQLLGFFLGLLGFIGTTVATLLPHWRSTAHVGANIITATSYMKGLWMECVWHSTGIYQCEIHRSLLALPADLQAARALMVLSCITSVLATVVSVMGMKCTRFARGSMTKTAFALSGGICFLCAGVLCLVTVSWTTHDVILDFYDPFLHSAMKYEIGLAVYLGFASACLSLFAGAVLCWNSKNTNRNHPSSPPPVFGTMYPPAPRYRPPEALRDNRASSQLSASSGYMINNFV